MSAVFALGVDEAKEGFVEIRHSMIPVLCAIFLKLSATNMKFQEKQIAVVRHQSKYCPNGITNESEDELSQLIHRLGQYHLPLPCLGQVNVDDSTVLSIHPTVCRDVVCQSESPLEPSDEIVQNLLKQYQSIADTKETLYK